MTMLHFMMEIGFLLAKLLKLLILLLKLPIDCDFMELLILFFFLPLIHLLSVDLLKLFKLILMLENIGFKHPSTRLYFSTGQLVLEELYSYLLPRKILLECPKMSLSQSLVVNNHA